MNILIAAAAEDTARADVLDVLRCRDSVQDALEELGHTGRTLMISRQDLSSPHILEEAILKTAPDLVFNLFEGFSDNAGAEVDFAVLLENLSVPFTGNSAETLRSCLNKMTVKKVLSDTGIPVPRGILVRKHAETSMPADLNFPLFLKPCCEDGNVGIDQSSFLSEADRHLLPERLKEKLTAFPGGVIVEEFIPGKEYSAGCIGTWPYEIAGISTMDYSRHSDLPPFYTYRAKWDESAPEYSGLTPSPDAPVPDDIRHQITKIIGIAGKILGLKSYFRIDMRERDGRVFVLDVNPNPDINTDSGLARQANAAGLSYSSLIRRIIDSARP